MIILNKDERSFTTGFFQYLLCKEVIHLFIKFPIRCPENRTGIGNVAEGPEGFIRKAIIISFFLFFRNPNAFSFRLCFVPVMNVGLSIGNYQEFIIPRLL